MGAVGGRRDDLLRLAPSRRRQIQEVAEAFAQAHELGHGHGALVLPAQHRLQDRTAVDYHVAADLTGQANHLGVTIEADIIKQKLPENNGAASSPSKLRQDRQARLHRAARPTTRST